jgi:hypothetical protein
VTYERYIADLQDQDAPGDGTVAFQSARDQQKNGKLRGYFIHGDQYSRRIDGKDVNSGYEHSLCCNDPRVIWAVTYSLARLVLEAPPVKVS